METLLAVVIGVLFGSGVYMIFRRSIVKLIIGFALLSHAVNLLLFTVGNVFRGNAPIIEPEQSSLASSFTDPLPQALVLTAIVISFGVMAFAIVLFKKFYQSVEIDDLDQMKSTDREYF